MAIAAKGGAGGGNLGDECEVKVVLQEVTRAIRCVCPCSLAEWTMFVRPECPRPGFPR